MKRLDLYRRGRHSVRNTGARETPVSLDRLREELDGDIVTRGGESVLVNERRFGFPLIHGDLEFGGRKPTPGPVSLLFPGIPRLSAPGDLLFFDTETTGLSGGAGTHIFLAGFASIDENGLRVTQYFLSSYSSEPFFLDLIGKELKNRSHLVSYNGRAFDYGIIKSRYIMNRMAAPAGHAHLDLLYSSRRIWKGLYPDFRLTTVEERALGFRREGDIPGSLVPEVYTAFLRSGGGNGLRDMTRVFEHNRNDVVSLAALLYLQTGIVENAGAPGFSPRDYNAPALSGLFLKSGETGRAKDLLLSDSGKPEALRELSLLYKRERDFGRALEGFERLSGMDIDIYNYIFACTEAAKLLEHVFRDYAKALAYTERMMEKLERVMLFTGRTVRHEREKALVLKRRGRLIRRFEAARKAE